MVYVIQFCGKLSSRIRTELVHLVGFIIRIYHDARSPERQKKVIDNTFFSLQRDEHRTSGKYSFP